jgi:hypothetical protein
MSEQLIAIYNQMKKQISSKYVDEKLTPKFHTEIFYSGPLQLINKRIVWVIGN